MLADPTIKPVKRASLMTWSAMQQKFPWSVIILLGGGFAMADGVQVITIKYQVY